MKLLSDYHTHSKNSRFGHGKDTIEAMVYRANELGLEELAITDHGLKNFFGTNKEKLKKARVLIDDINTWSKTKILLGIEADILNTKDVIWVYLPLEFELDDDGVRFMDKKLQENIDREFKKVINKYNIKVFEVRGSVEERIEQLKQIINNYE